MIDLVDDSRWKFKDEGMLPNPRPYKGIIKDYKSGRREGSTVPLELSQFVLAMVRRGVYNTYSIENLHKYLNTTLTNSLELFFAERVIDN
jgi:hypothetical protein